jgi:hypothetical protein
VSLVSYSVGECALDMRQPRLYNRRHKILSIMAYYGSKRSAPHVALIRPS